MLPSSAAPVDPGAPIRPYRPSGAYAKRNRAKRTLSRYFGLLMLGAVSASAITLSLMKPAPVTADLSEPTAHSEEAMAMDMDANNNVNVETAMAVDVTAHEELAPEAIASAENAQLPVSMRLQVSGGDTLLNILTDTGVTYEEAYGAVQAVRKIYDPKKLDIGQHIAVSLDPSMDNPTVPVISSLSFPISQTASVHVTRDDDGVFEVKKIEAPLSKAPVRASGVITSSLYETGIELGVPASMLGEMIKVLSYDVDFQRDIKRGNKLEVVYERLQTPDGKTSGFAGLAYASLDLGDRVLSFYRYTDKNGVTDYYNEKGESLRKALLRTPINGARVSSGFGMRHHPVLGYTKMHRGVDFAAAIGTPIYAAGDGTIAFAGIKGGYGNYVQIKHTDKYATAYGHASRIAPGIKPGVRVRQGQVIAYVGSTGRSTGPHLHYEILMGGTQINPSGVKFKTGNTLAGRELASFRKNVDQVQAMRKSDPKVNKLAMLRSSATN